MMVPRSRPERRAPATLRSSHAGQASAETVAAPGQEPRRDTPRRRAAQGQQACPRQQAPEGAGDRRSAATACRDRRSSRTYQTVSVILSCSSDDREGHRRLSDWRRNWANTPGSTGHHEHADPQPSTGVRGYSGAGRSDQHEHHEPRPPATTRTNWYWVSMPAAVASASRAAVRAAGPAAACGRRSARPARRKSTQNSASSEYMRAMLDVMRTAGLTDQTRTTKRGSHRVAQQAALPTRTEPPR